MPDKKHTTSVHENEVKTFLDWTSPGRPFRKKNKEYYLTAILLVLLVEVLLFLFSQYMLMLVVLSLLFFSFSLSFTPPANFQYRISSEGVQVQDKFFIWSELYDFYFKTTEDQEVLHIRTHAFIPGELILTLDGQDREKVKGAMLPYLPFREFVKPTFMEKSGNWVSENFPLERKK